MDLTELVKYRKAYSLSQLPPQGDNTHLVIPITGSSKPMARSGIHEFVESVFRASAARLRQQGPEFEAAAVHIE